MKLTNNEITLALTTINKLSQIEVPIKTAYEMLKTAKALETQGKIVESIRNKLIEKYGKDGRVLPGTDGFDKFIKELNPILQETINVKVPKFKLPEDIKISLRDLSNIEKLLA